MGLAHWDDVEGRRAAKGEMDAVWQMLGRAAGTKGVGVNRVRVAAGKKQLGQSPSHVRRGVPWLARATGIPLT